MVNSAFWLVDKIFLQLNILRKVRVNLQLTGTRHCGWEEKQIQWFTGVKVHPRNFSAMYSRAATCFGYSVELEKLAVTKILPRRLEMCVEFQISYAGSARNLCQRRVNSGKEVKLCNATETTGGPDVVCDLHTWQYCVTFEPFKRMYENGSKIALNSTCSKGFK